MSRRAWRVRRAGLTLLFAGSLSAMACGEAWAQTPSRPTRRPDLDVGVVWTRGGSLGSANANLTTPSGSAQPLFSTSSEMGPALGAEAHLTFPLVGHLRGELTGTWSRAELRTHISADFEGAEPVTSTLRISVFTAEGSALWYFRRRGKLQPFVRGGAGWMRELTGDTVLKGDGIIANAGAGMKYWWRERDKGFLKRFGVRLEGRLVVRSGGLALGTATRLIGPAATASAMIGF